MERNSPKSLCHLSRESRRWLEGMELRSSAKRSSLRSGKVMVDDTVSMIQPRTFLQVAHDASPLRNLVTEMGSVRCGGSWSGWRGRRMRSIDSMRRRRTFVRRDSGPWAAAIKSSTKRSTGILVAVSLVDCCAGGSATTSVDGVSASASRRCGPARRRLCSCWLAMSAIVSVTAQKAGGDSVQPMGKAKGKAISGGSPSPDGMATPSLGMSSSRSHTR
eukprot:scaffold3079_cov119-Cylindrotheca_fusiformis.AAC.13